MSQKIYFWALAVGTIGAGGAFVALISTTSPSYGGRGLLATFFCALFLVLIGIFSSVMTIVWCRNGACDQYPHRMLRAFRHGALLAVIGLLCVIMQWYGYLVWWTVALCAGCVALFEAYIILVRRSF